jgi:hypothetical protein
MSEEFDPDWTLAPAAALRAWLKEHGVSPNLLALWCGGGDVAVEARQMIQDVLDRKPLTEAHAKMLERSTRVPANTWLSLERGYRTDLAAGRIDTTPED